ncbi:MAG: zinc dependent phospholipase C family protein [Bacilli bacterium]|nr:zinc dependent phospholipase C family protein [Bacilli bacterium]MBP3635566.1 zinc dependent phospholipase C family protein [Bacilli bacterium]
MAGTITHAYFASDVYNKLDESIKKNLSNYKENLKTYSQGHDIFFFITNFNKTRKIGNYMHKHNTRDFFKNMITYIYDNDLQNNYEIISFLYGYICHYSLDSIVHPYITYKSGIFNKKRKETYKYNTKHSNMENYIDAYMINKREGILPNKFKIHKFCFNTKVSKILCKMVNHVYKKTYGFNNMSLYLKQGIFNMRISYRLLRYDPFRLKLKFYKLIDKITSDKTSKLFPISYAYDLDNDEYYLNLNKKTWCHPRYKDETYNYSFLELYDIATFNALKIINNVNKILYKNDDINNLDNIFLNTSFSSGKDCNDKAKNRYFEF